MLKIREQNHTPHRRFEMLYPAEGDAQAMVDAMTALGDAVVAFAAEQAESQSSPTATYLTSAQHFPRSWSSEH